MVSNARLDLPEPERPVNTIMRSRGNSSETFFRLCTRAPCTAMVVRAVTRDATAGASGLFDAPLDAPVLLLAIGRPRVEKRQFLDLDIASAGEAHGQRYFGEHALVSQVFARRSHALDAEVSLEMVVDLRGRACLADFA